MRDISLIVCTRNRGAFLQRTLQSIGRAVRAAQGENRIEVILVDNGSSDDTQDVLLTFAKNAGFSVRIVHEGRAGLSIARNAGIRHINSPIIAFTDDDCELADDFFVRLETVFKNNSKPLLIGGRVELGTSEDLPLTIKTCTEIEQFSREQSPAGFIHGCNMAMSGDVVKVVGCFDERLGAGSAFKSGEDTDFTVRAFLVGVTVQYRPEIMVRHFHGRRAVAEAARLFRQYEYGNGALLAKHGLRYRRLIKSFAFNAKDSVLERLGYKKPIDPILGIDRAGILACHILGASNFIKNEFFALLGKARNWGRAGHQGDSPRAPARQAKV